MNDRVPVSGSHAAGQQQVLTNHFVRGGNLPWINAGWDFGQSPYDGTRPNVEANFRSDLQLLKNNGVDVVRVFLLGGGKSYVSNQQGRDEMSEYCVKVDHNRIGAYYHLLPAKAAPPLPSGFVEDFVRLCKLAAEIDILIMPTLLSFEFFSPCNAEGGQGRFALVFGNEALPTSDLESAIVLPDPLFVPINPGVSTEKNKRRAIRSLLGQILVPLLNALEADETAKSAIFAWDVCNEPDWVIKGHSHLSDIGMMSQGHIRSVPANDMCLFLRGAIERIARRKYNFTIGFAEVEPRWIRSWFTNALRRIANRWGVHYIHQGHYYPRTPASVPRLLPVASLDSRFRQFPCIIGEFPSRYPDYANDSLLCPRWKNEDDAELETETDPVKYLYKRIRHIEGLGYSGAFFWSLNAHDLQTGAYEGVGPAGQRERMLKQLWWAAGSRVR